LPGGPPFRPGLCRRDDGQGASIALELWAIPKDAMGDFMVGVPSPLTIATVEVVDGSLVKGFLCEAVGTCSAEDISALGDWRSYLARRAKLMA
jgi:allophanate hydrolase